MVGQTLHASKAISETETRRAVDVGRCLRGSALKAYIDSSALVKVFVDEDGTDEILSLMERTDANVTCAIASVECRSAFARREREGLLSSAHHRAVLRSFTEHLDELLVVPIDGLLIGVADELATDRALRAADAIHLSAAQRIADVQRDPLVFACWDRRLREAVSAAGLGLYPEAIAGDS